MENLDDLFARFDGFEDIFSKRLFFYLSDEIFGDSELDIGL